MTKSFTAQLKDIEKMTVKNMRYVAAEAIQDVMEAAMTPSRGITKGGTFEEGKIPVAETELINTLTSDGIKGENSYTVAIAGFDIGDTLKFAWTADHALVQEVGNSKIRGRHFVGANARKFPEFVAKRAKEV